MTPLRLQMIEDMKSAGLAPRTQAVYIDAVRRLAAHYRRSPDQLSEDEVRRYLLGQRERGVALGRSRSITEASNSSTAGRLIAIGSFPLVTNFFV
jgi:Phage integrase, N-terminal SAM-like domain